MVIQFKYQSVKFLWSPNGRNEAWRLTTKPSVIPATERFLRRQSAWRIIQELKIQKQKRLA